MAVFCRIHLVTPILNPRIIEPTVLDGDLKFGENFSEGGLGDIFSDCGRGEKFFARTLFSEKSIISEISIIPWI